ncbi:conserved domain protein [delta proteobacterium NaphS2]|nr:conserved domain protein [delta proteobacterium NaphS2]
MKKQEYRRQFVNRYFWRTYDKKEIDLVEEQHGKLAGFEVKWRRERSAPPKDWSTAYPDADFQLINRENYLDFIQ